MFRRRIVMSMFVLLIAVSGCTVQPLYSSGSRVGVTDVNVFINPADSRVEQVVRNRLIFLVNGGAAQPSDAAYSVDISATASTAGVLQVSNPSSDSDTTASRVTVTGTLTITNNDENLTTRVFTRSATALFDRSTQEFANDRAEIDAQDRAANQLAEQFRTLILTSTR